MSEIIYKLTKAGVRIDEEKIMRELDDAAAKALHASELSVGPDTDIGHELLMCGRVRKEDAFYHVAAEGAVRDAILLGRNTKYPKDMDEAAYAAGVLVMYGATQRDKDMARLREDLAASLKNSPEIVPGISPQNAKTIMESTLSKSEKTAMLWHLLGTKKFSVKPGAQPAKEIAAQKRTVRIYDPEDISGVFKDGSEIAAEILYEALEKYGCENTDGRSFNPQNLSAAAGEIVSSSMTDKEKRQALSAFFEKIVTGKIKSTGISYLVFSKEKNESMEYTRSFAEAFREIISGKETFFYRMMKRRAVSVSQVRLLQEIMRMGEGRMPSADYVRVGSCIKELDRTKTQYDMEYIAGKITKKLETMPPETMKTEVQLLYGLIKNEYGFDDAGAALKAVQLFPEIEEGKNKWDAASSAEYFVRKNEEKVRLLFQNKEFLDKGEGAAAFRKDAEDIRMRLKKSARLIRAEIEKGNLDKAWEDTAKEEFELSDVLRNAVSVSRKAGPGIKAIHAAQSRGDETVELNMETCEAVMILAEYRKTYSKTVLSIPNS